MNKARVVVVVNKWWEFDPIMNVLLHDKARPAGEVGWPFILRHPRSRPKQAALPEENMSPAPRAVYTFPRVSIELWCISDLLEHLPDKPQFQSSSQRKAEQLPKIFASGPADLVIAMGTAGYPDDVSRNGSVFIGTEVFMHNCHPGGSNPDSQWEDGPFNIMIESGLSREIFAALTAMKNSRRLEILKRFLLAPLNPAKYADVSVDYDAVAVGAVNVTDYTEYAQTDAATLKAFGAVYTPAMAHSLETTHGLIRVFGGDAFMFISGITDRVGYFDQEVNPREYVQNMSAAHNAGVVLAWMLPRIVQLF